MTGWTALLEVTRTVFGAPSFALFTDLTGGWVLSPGRRTVTRMLTVGDPDGRPAHDAYHRFIRTGRWSMSRLWRALAVHAIGRFHPTGVIPLDCDDTLLHKSGRKVDGAGIFRDAVRSTRSKTVYALGLNLVVLTVRISPPWGGCPLALPVNARLHRKRGTSTVELAAQMIREVAGWLPDRAFHVCCDGAYASLAGAGLPRTQITSRMRRDAAIYAPTPPRTGRRGRPRLKGRRLPAPPELPGTAQFTDWQPVKVDERGRIVDRLVCTGDVLWYQVNAHQLVRLSIVRDPAGRQPDDFFFTTDLTTTAADTPNRYAGRWSIEVTNRDSKQLLGGEDPQSWKGQGPERAACLGLWLHAAVWCWYLTHGRTSTRWPVRLWYPRKCAPSFLDALATLRRALWTARITGMSADQRQSTKITELLVDTLAYAA